MAKALAEVMPGTYHGLSMKKKNNLKKVGEPSSYSITLRISLGCKEYTLSRRNEHVVL
ncbi:hypothetical protein L195_g034118 [Trifolium pratense]|uniref:Uncharacterized protein n=1 Tax=Trifolium pratense TaxID=57577 RepID=A0A2K3LHX8_TRIPR|nr:hypothetical protein L195_g034118 [Trifolium pratense]